MGKQEAVGFHLLLVPEVVFSYDLHHFGHPYRTIGVSEVDKKDQGGPIGGVSHGFAHIQPKFIVSGKDRDTPLEPELSRQFRVLQFCRVL